MVNNFQRYKEFLRSCGVPEKVNITHLKAVKYYVIELMRRGKDNPDMPAANVHFKNYYIYSLEDIDKYMKEIIVLCTVLNMRAYASVNVKDSESVMLATAQEIIRRVSCKDYRKPWAIFESCSGKYLERTDKKWVIDIDDVSENGIIVDNDTVKKYEDVIRSLSDNEEDNILREFVTNSGIHLITTPFNRYEYDHIANRKGLKKSDDIVHANHLTLLYYNPN